MNNERNQEKIIPGQVVLGRNGIPALIPFCLRHRTNHAIPIKENTAMNAAANNDNICMSHSKYAPTNALDRTAMTE